MRKLIVLSVLVFGLATTSTAQAERNVLFHPSPLIKNLLCVHSHEATWTDPNSPYWGGLQMDLSFQKTYGWMKIAKNTRREHKVYFLNKWGTADHWPIWAQLVAGLHGYFSRGWTPWRNTAHLCGLI